MDRLVTEAEQLYDTLCRMKWSVAGYNPYRLRLERLTERAWRRVLRRSGLVVDKKSLEELRLLRELRVDIERWNEGGGDARDLRYAIETLQKLEEAFPVGKDDLEYIKGTST